MDAPSSDARQFERFDVVIPARCWARGRQLHRLVITDLAQSGCRVEGRGLMLRPGERVIVSTDVIEGQIGVVRWATSDRAGIAFAHKLYGPVLSHLVQQHERFLPPPQHAYALGLRSV